MTTVHDPQLEAAAGAPTDAAYTGGNGTLTSILKGIWTLLGHGQANKANSIPVVIASDQTLPIAVTFPATQNVGGSVVVSNLPSLQAVSLTDGADATLGSKSDAAATAVSTNATLVAWTRGIFNRLAPGQQAKAASLPVTIASDQGALAVSVGDGSSVALGTTNDAAYASGNGTVVALLKGLFARLVKGQTTMSGSLPVTIASDQTAVPVSGTFYQATQPVSGSLSVANFPATQVVSANDGAIASIGATTDSAGALTVIGRLKQVVSLLSTTLVVNSYAGAPVTPSTPPAATNSASDTPYTFSSQIKHLVMQNNTAVTVNFAFDIAATPGSFTIAPGQFESFDVPCTVLHLYTGTAQNINGSTSGNLVVQGWS